jgi:hypothetical protein
VLRDYAVDMDRDPMDNIFTGPRGTRIVEEVVKALGCRYTTPGVLGFGFQPTLQNLPASGVKVSDLSSMTTCVINDIFQTMVPDEMHVFKGCWEWALHVSHSLLLAMFIFPCLSGCWTESLTY